MEHGFSRMIKYPAHESHVKEHIIKLLNNTDDSTFATHIIRPIAMFHDPSLLPEISKAYDGQKIDEFIGKKKDMEKIIKGEYDDETPRLDVFTKKYDVRFFEELLLRWQRSLRNKTLSKRFNNSTLSISLHGTNDLRKDFQ